MMIILVTVTVDLVGKHMGLGPIWDIRVYCKAKDTVRVLCSQWWSRLGTQLGKVLFSVGGTQAWVPLRALPTDMSSVENAAWGT